MKKKDYTGDGLLFFNAVAVSGLNNEEIQKNMGVSNGTFYRLYKKASFDADEKKAAAAALGLDEATLFDATRPENPRRIPIVGEGLAGTDMELNVSDTPPEQQYIDVGDLLRDSEAAFIVYGNSMTPAYPPGCVIGIRRNLDKFIQPGETYLLLTKSNRVFKRLYYTDDKKGFTCFSDNVMKHETGPMQGKYFYPPFDVDGEDVISIFDITGMIKRNRNSAIMARQT